MAASWCRTRRSRAWDAARRPSCGCRLPARTHCGWRARERSRPVFRIIVYWLGGLGVDVVGLRRAGTLLSSVAGRFLVGEPLFSLLEDMDR